MTIRGLLEKNVAERPGRNALVWSENKTWMRRTWREYLARVRDVAEGYGTRFDLKPREENVAIILGNSPTWLEAYLAQSGAGVSVVPLDPKLHDAEVEYILADSEAVVVTTDVHHLKMMMGLAPKLPKLRGIVCVDGVINEGQTIGKVKVVGFDKLRISGGGAWYDAHVAREEDVASIIYTSGTTGRSKGAMLTHANFCAQLRALEFFTVRKDDNFLLVLPLHHAFAFTANFIVPLACKCEVSMVENLRTIPENMKETRPTVLLAVPLLAEKMLGAIMKKLRKSAAARALMAMGLSRVVGRKIVDQLGGRLRIIICGGAASDPDVLRQWTKFGVKTLQGYGLTETAPISALAPVNEIRFESVGKALPGHELRIADPNGEGVGEIEVRGPSVMKGYFRNEDATKECFDGDWFRTGDLGTMDANGYVTITGRKKSLIVNREGKNIYPEEVELVINACPHVLESIVLGYHVPGEQKGEHVGAIVVADLDKIAEERNKTDAASASPLSDDQIRKLCVDEIHAAMKEISTYKHPRRIQVRFEPLQKTNTLKVKRYLYSLDGASDA